MDAVTADSDTMDAPHDEGNDDGEASLHEAILERDAYRKRWETARQRCRDIRERLKNERLLTAQLRREKEALAQQLAQVQGEREEQQQRVEHLRERVRALKATMTMTGMLVQALTESPE